MWEKYFAIAKSGSNLRTEILAGITTFMTMAYILAVNPSILSQVGMDSASVFAATAISASVATLIMAFLANLPVGLAPGMGLNAFFAFSVVMGMGYSWQFALTAVFIEGIIFILLTLTNLREAILESIPLSLKQAISAGIGLFIAFIGLKSAGIVVDNPATLVAIAPLGSPTGIVAMIGLAVIGLCLCFKVKGALLLGIVVATLVGIPLGVTNLANFDTSQLLSVPSIAPTFMQFEWNNIFTLDMLVVVVTFLFVDLFDTLGTLIGVCSTGGFLTKDGKVPRAKRALMADAIGTTLGAVLGTSTVTSYVESASGVAEGGRTGMTALTVAVLFAISLLFAPLFLLVPASATAPVLVIVGLFMMASVVDIDFSDYVVAIPAFLTILMMPLAYSIAAGIMWGMVAHVFLCLVTGQMKKISVLSVALAALFAWKLIVG